jgi:hypothetical protein
MAPTQLDRVLSEPTTSELILGESFYHNSPLLSMNFSDQNSVEDEQQDYSMASMGSESPEETKAQSSDSDKQAQAFEEAVSRGDQKAIKEFLENAPPELLNKVVSKLTQDGKLGLLVDHMAAEDNLNNLTKKLDAENLANVSEYLDNTDLPPDLANGVRYRFAQAVARNTPSDVKVEYVKIMSDRGAIMMSQFEKAYPTTGALTTAYILSTMKDYPGNAAKVMQELDNGEMRSVVYATTNPSPGTSITQNQYSSPPHLSRDVLEACANVNDPVLKSRMFIAAGLNLGKANNSYMVQGMTKILESDTAGVMRFLANQSNDIVQSSVRRDVFASYTREMFRTNQADALANVLKNLLEPAGNDLAAWLYSPEPTKNGGTAHPNAEMLGFFMGGMIAGAKQLKGDPRMINTVIDLLSDKLPGVGWISNWTDIAENNGSDKWVQFASALEDAIFSLPANEFSDGGVLGAYEAGYRRASKAAQ